MDLKPLERFLNSDKDFKLTKMSSKRDKSHVYVGHSETGHFSLYTYPATDKLPEQMGATISGLGFRYLRTSPIVKIVDVTETTTTFETEGAVYKLEQL